MKKATTILLLIVLLMQAGGMLIVYKLQRTAHQNQMQELTLAGNASTEKLTLSLQDYNHSTFNQHEICLNGKMYDIVSCNVIGDKVELIAVRDTKEESMLDELNEFVEQLNHAGSKLPKFLKQQLPLFYIPIFETGISPIAFINQLHFNPFKSIPLSVTLEVCAPPPQRLA